MTTIMPQSELVRKAAQYIQEQLTDDRGPLASLLDDAGMRFNLSPKEAEMLKDFFKNANSAE